METIHIIQTRTRPHSTAGCFQLRVDTWASTCLYLLKDLKVSVCQASKPMHIKRNPSIEKSRGRKGRGLSPNKKRSLSPIQTSGPPHLGARHKKSHSERSKMVKHPFLSSVQSGSPTAFADMLSRKWWGGYWGRCSEAWVRGPSRAGYVLRTTSGNWKLGMRVAAFGVMLEWLE